MPDRRSAAGWVIELVSPNPSGAPPTLRYFNVNEPDIAKAIVAAKKKAGVNDIVGQVVRALTSEEVKKLGLHKGQAKPA